MNWGFIGWVLGIILTLYVLKFAIMALRSLFSKESMESLMDIAGNKISRANKNLTKKMKQNVAKRKAEKMAKKIDEERPMVIIR